MIELFFFKKLFLTKIIPYTLLIISVSYILFEVIAPKSTKEDFYQLSDKLFFKFIKRPVKKIQTHLLQLVKNYDKKSNSFTENFKKKRMDAKEKSKKKKEEAIIKKNDRQKRKAQKRIDFLSVKIKLKYKIKKFIKSKLRKVVKRRS